MLFWYTLIISTAPNLLCAGPTCLTTSQSQWPSTSLQNSYHATLTTRLNLTVLFVHWAERDAILRSLLIQSTVLLSLRYSCSRAGIIISWTPAHKAYVIEIFVEQDLKQLCLRSNWPMRFSSTPLTLTYNSWSIQLCCICCHQRPLRVLLYSHRRGKTTWWATWAIP
jgi:hypothetical protein